MKDLIACLQILYFMFKPLIGQNLLHLASASPVQSLFNAILDVGCKAFIKPKIPPSGVGHQVTRPGVRQLVRNNGNSAPVTHDQRWSDEYETRVLHTTKRKTRRQHQNVKAIP